MDKISVMGELLKNNRRKVDAAIRNQELQIGWQEGSQGGNDHFGSHMGTSDEER